MFEYFKSRPDMLIRKLVLLSASLRGLFLTVPEEMKSRAYVTCKNVLLAALDPACAEGRLDVPAQEEA